MSHRIFLYKKGKVGGKARLSPSGAAAPPPSQREARGLGSLCEGAAARRRLGERAYRKIPFPFTPPRKFPLR